MKKAGKAVKVYRNYIFDLYNTLIEIHTDEKKASFWEKMADYYNSFGTRYTPKGLQKAYLDACREKDRALQALLQTAYAEIELGEIFLELLEGAGEEILDKDQWVRDTALTFRVLSREKLRAYPASVPVLQRLKEMGCGVYLLSNAQSLFTRPEMRVTGTWDLFDGIYLSSDKGVRKPERRFLLDLLQEYGLERTESVMVGNDFYSDMRIAASCGVDGIFLNTDGYSKEQMAAMSEDIGYSPVILESGDLYDLLP